MKRIVAMSLVCMLVLWFCTPYGIDEQSVRVQIDGEYEQANDARIIVREVRHEFV